MFCWRFKIDFHLCVNCWHTFRKTSLNISRIIRVQASFWVHLSWLGSARSKLRGCEFEFRWWQTKIYLEKNSTVCNVNFLHSTFDIEAELCLTETKCNFSRNKKKILALFPLMIFSQTCLRVAFYHKNKTEKP